MKHLTITLLTLLMSMGALTEVINLSCKSSEYINFAVGEKVNEINYVSLRIDSAKKEVITGDDKLEFQEKGNIIVFEKIKKDEYDKECPLHNPFSKEFSLDRVTGNLRVIFTMFLQCYGAEKGRGNITEYQCTEVKPLF